jgi:hypothetical protein
MSALPSKKVLTPSFSIVSGGRSSEELKKLVKEVGVLRPEAESVLDSQNFKPSGKAEKVDLIVLYVRDLFNKEVLLTKNPRVDRVFDSAWLVTWSEKYLDGQLLDPCNPEDGAHLRAKYVNQPNLEDLWMGMEPIIDSEGNLRVFGLECNVEEGLIFNAYWAKPESLLELDDKIVLRIRRRPPVAL